jgi:hypothetical protein
VEVRAGAVGAGGTVVHVAEKAGNRFPVRSIATMAEQGFRSPILTATIRNVGRQPVTIQECNWKAGDMSLAQPRTRVGDSFPRRLELGDQCVAAIDLTIITAMLRTSGAVLNDRNRDVKAVVELGTGKSVHSKPLEIPPQLDPPADIPS